MRHQDIRVLIAEDDYLVGEMIKGVAESIQYTIVGEATNGIEAVEMTQALRPDVVIMDIRMPEMDGITAAQHIRMQCPTPIVILTAYETPDLIERASAAGIAAYLVKPPQAHEMERAITIALARFNDLIELGRLKAEAEAAVRVRDRLFALIAHDLTAPLTTIKGYADIVRLQLTESPNVSKQVFADLEKIDGAVNQVTRQIGEFLDIARMRDGKRLSLQRSPTDLIALVGRTAADAQRTTDIHTIYVNTLVSELVGNVDANRLIRVFNNLLSNAVKYDPDGGDITLTITQEQIEMQPWAVVVIRDSGVGIPANDLPSIFTPFHRANNVSDSFQGVGLGLASVRQIIEQHGGTAIVESAIGQGTTFTIRLPLSAPAVQESDTPAT